MRRLIGLLGIAALAAFAPSGCTPQQKAELKAAEVTALADANMLCSVVIGAAQVAAANPVLAQALASEAGAAAQSLALKAGVSPDEAATLKADLADPAMLQAAAAKAAQIKARLAVVAAPPGQ